MKHTLLTLLVLALAAIASPAASVQLEWDPSPDTDITGYIVHHGPESGKYDTKVQLGNVTTYTFDGITPSREYFVAVSAVNAAGLQSALSNEVRFRIPNPAGNLRLIKQTPQANGMKLEVMGDPAPKLALLRDNGNGKWKEIHVFKPFIGEGSFVDKNWNKNKTFRWKVEDKS